MTNYDPATIYQSQEFQQELAIQRTFMARVFGWMTIGLLVTAVTAFALAPLLFEAERPGTEILHPVAVVIFSGLISSTLLDTYLTPALFWLFGRKSAERLMDERDAEAF